MDAISLDTTDTTPVWRGVVEALGRYVREVCGKAASAFAVGRRARRALEDARERTAALLGAHPDEVVFTSGTTEANNIALFGLAGDPPGHLITSPIEHPCVVEPFRRLEEVGFTVTNLPVDMEGVVSVPDLA